MIDRSEFQYSASITLSLKLNLQILDENIVTINELKTT